jgi:hypothetical protein
MSSGGGQVGVCGWFGVEEERAVDHVGPSTFECPDGFSLGVAAISPAFEELPRRSRSRRRDRWRQSSTAQTRSPSNLSAQLSSDR